MSITARASIHSHDHIEAVEGSPSQARRLAGSCGVGFVALTLFSNIVLAGAGFPRPGTAAGDVASWASQHHDALMLGAFLETLGQALLLVFIIFLTRRAEPTGGVLSTLVVIMAAMMFGINFVVTATSIALIDLARTSAGPESVSALLQLMASLRPLDNIPAVVGYGTLGVLLARHKVLPSVLAWWPLVATGAAFAMTPLALFVPALRIVGFATFVLFIAWVGCAAIATLVRVEASTADRVAPQAVVS